MSLRVALSCCQECPFRRASSRGGMGNPANYLYPYWKEEVPVPPCRVNDAARCRGILTMMRNSGRTWSGEELAEAVARLDPDREECFAFPFEFIEHHSGPDKVLDKADESC